MEVVAGNADPGLRHTPLGLRPLVLWCTVGLLLGALLGYLAGQTRPGVSKAEASVSILPAPSVTTTSVGGAGGDQDATAFIQSELLVLNGRSLKEAVQAELDVSQEPDITSAQVGLTYNVSLVASAATDEAAVELLTSTINTYAARRKQALSADIDRAVTSVSAQLDTVQTSLANPALRPATTATSSQVTQVVALQEEYGRLLAINSALGLARGQVARAVTVIEPAAPAAPGLGSSVLFAVAGALLGAAAALGLLLLLRRTSTRVRAVDDLSDLGLPVLLPALPKDTLAAVGTTSSAVSTRSRLLGARLVTDAGDSRAVVMFGVSEDAAGGFAATAIAAALAERGPVLLILASDAVNARTHRRFTSAMTSAGLATLPAGPLSPQDVRAASVKSHVPGLTVLPAGRPGTRRSLERLVSNGLLEAAMQTAPTVVLEAPPLSTSSIVLELARRAEGAVLVVARDRASEDDIVTVRDIFTAQHIPLHGALLTAGTSRTVGRLLAGLRARRRPEHPASTQPARESTTTPPRPAGETAPDTPPEDVRADAAEKTPEATTEPAPEPTTVEPAAAVPAQVARPAPAAQPSFAPRSAAPAPAPSFAPRPVEPPAPASEYRGAESAQESDRTADVPERHNVDSAAREQRHPESVEAPR